MKGRISESVFLLFLREYVRNFHETGTIGPDSSACVRGLLRSVPFDSAGLILEYGAGSGRVSREIVKRKNPNGKLICFEKNRSFCRLLQKTTSGENVFILNDDAFSAAKILHSRFAIRRQSVDCIISTLPCSSIGIGTLIRDSVVPLLKRDGIFVQYMHTASLLKGFTLKPVLRRYFSRIDEGFVLRNIPPTFIYTCRGHSA